nr:sensor histidine kinase [Shewanella mesophila]
MAMIAIGIAITPINSGSLSLFTFAGFFIGFNYSLRIAFYCLIAMAAILAMLSSLFDFHYYFMVYGTALIAGVGFFGVAEQKRVATKLAEHRSQQEITQLATMLERERIARDLHDIMGHSLSSISLKAELAQKLLAKSKLDQASAELQELNAIARDSLSQIRQTVSGYKHKGLASSVTYLCQALRDKGMSVTLKGDIPQLPPDIETHVILSLTELCNNIIRHSSASHCDIVFADTEGALSITVTDDASIASINEGNGLTGIRERLAQFGGTLDYQLNTNTHFTLTLPR